MKLDDMILAISDQVRYDKDLYIPDYNEGNRYGPAISIHWKTESRGPYGSVETEPEFHSLVRILELLCPSLSFLHYKRICMDLIKEDSYEDEDWYNPGTYSVKYVLLTDLYDFLTEKGYV